MTGGDETATGGGSGTIVVETTTTTKGQNKNLERKPREKASYERGTASSRQKENEQMEYKLKQKPDVTTTKVTVHKFEDAGKEV